MKTSQLFIIVAAILSTSVIDIAYREWEKEPARKAARAAQAEKKFQDGWSSAKSGLRYFHDACKDYFHDADGKKGDVAGFQSTASLWLSDVAGFVDAYPKSPMVETTLLSDFVPQVQPALTSPNDESIRAAWVLAEKVCKQFSILQ
ncbi:hypothetical protein [Brevifollis gellanilyticus]|uniref:Uncharacterized protein n=1 Tax=Brevifollis gellanilyticus TaxID=748831 RepID=A0A512MFF7_9BACT|nr:hypothetical protein [Brevifollis gellanilyticus]GEP45483.1 hypothetical protein BGE01nite_47740 [Brevifollis gellanilyticus]